jgi:hypothetical protein
MIAAPPSGLSRAERARLEIVLLPEPDDMEELAVYRFKDTKQFVAEDDETAALIREAFPSADVRLVK